MAFPLSLPPQIILLLFHFRGSINKDIQLIEDVHQLGTINVQTVQFHWQFIDLFKNELRWETAIYTR